MVNKAILIGRLGKDPEYKELSGGKKVTAFSIACTEKYKDSTTGEKKEVTEWVNIKLWGAQADVAARYLHKGDLIYIEGKISTRSWEKDGVTRYATEVVGYSMTMLSTKKTESSAGPAPAMPIDGDGWPKTPPAASAPIMTVNPKPAPANDIDDLPF